MGMHARKHSLETLDYALRIPQVWAKGHTHNLSIDPSTYLYMDTNIFNCTHTQTHHGEDNPSHTLTHYSWSNTRGCLSSLLSVRLLFFRFQLRPLMYHFSQKIVVCKLYASFANQNSVLKKRFMTSVTLLQVVRRVG